MNVRAFGPAVFFMDLGEEREVIKVSARRGFYGPIEVSD